MSAEQDSDDLTCMEVARLLSERHDCDLGEAEGARLRLHLAVCLACRNVEQQFDLIRRAMQRLSKGGDHEGG